MKKQFKNQALKAIEFINKLDNIEKINEICYSVRPFAHHGYSNQIIIIHFKDDENGNEKDSEMYLFDLSKQEWELSDK